MPQGRGKFVIDSVAACGRSIEAARRVLANTEGESLTTLQKRKTRFAETRSMPESALIEGRETEMEERLLALPKALSGLQAIGKDEWRGLYRSFARRGCTIGGRATGACEPMHGETRAVISGAAAKSRRKNTTEGDGT
jgi:hypothetical protein